MGSTDKILQSRLSPSEAFVRKAFSFPCGTWHISRGGISLRGSTGVLGSYSAFHMQIFCLGTMPLQSEPNTAGVTVPLSIAGLPLTGVSNLKRGAGCKSDHNSSTDPEKRCSSLFQENLCKLPERGRGVPWLAQTQLPQGVCSQSEAAWRGFRFTPVWRATCRKHLFTSLTDKAQRPAAVAG